MRRSADDSERSDRPVPGAKGLSLSIAKQVLLALVVLVALAAGGYRYYSQMTGDADAAVRNEPRPVSVELAPVLQGTLAQRIEAVGTTLARRAIDVVPLVAGRVVALNVEPGSRVEAGAVLARLDETSERAAVDEARAQRREAELALERARQLQASNNVAQATVDQLQAAYLAAQARVEQAEKTLADRTVRAPFAGIVGLRQVDVGARVDDSTVLTTLDDLAEIEIDFTVPELVFGAIRRGQQVLATSASFPGRSFTGQVALIDSRIDPVTRAFHVRALLPNDDLALPSGMFMHVELILSERVALTVPEAAILAAGAASYVFTVADGKAVRHEVSLGQRERGRVEVTAGLAAGAEVVVAGTERLRNGGPVRVVPGRPAPPAVAAPPEQPAAAPPASARDVRPAGPATGGASSG